MVRCITCNVYHMRQFCRFFYCLAWFDTAEFNSLPCPNNEMYDDAVFDDRFRCQLVMFGIRVLIGISRLLHSHIAYKIDTAKIISAFFRISYWLHDLIRLNSIVCHAQTTNISSKIVKQKSQVTAPFFLSFDMYLSNSSVVSESYTVYHLVLVAVISKYIYLRS